VSKETEEQAEKVHKSINLFELVANAAKNAAVNGISAGLMPALEGLTLSLARSLPAIRKWATETGEWLGEVAKDFVTLFSGSGGELKTDFVKGFVNAKEQVLSAVTAIKTGFTGLIGVLDNVATLINSVFGTHYSGTGLAIGAAVIYMAGGFGVLATAVKLASAAFVFFLTNPVGLALTGIALAALAIYQNWETIGPVVQDLWDKYQAFGAWVREGLAGAFDWAFGKIIAGIQTVLGWLETLYEKAKAVAAAIGSVIGGSTGGSTDQTGQNQFASGGYIRGAGSGTSDSIPARLSNGEYVVRAAAVNRIGVGALDRLNRGFSMGGLVDAFNSSIALPRFAEGGRVSAAVGTPINLHIGNRSYHTSADASVAGALIREARTRQMLSTGNKPAWAGA
jgi:hypothetical protein